MKIAIIGGGPAGLMAAESATAGNRVGGRRDQIEAQGKAILTLDLTPDRDRASLTRNLSRPRSKRTIATHLQRHAEWRLRIWMSD
ncbi:MAG: hypothetical protein ACT4O4_09980 [Nitrospiraceae bacterium]